MELRSGRPGSVHPPRATADRRRARTTPPMARAGTESGPCTLPRMQCDRCRRDQVLPQPCAMQEVCFACGGVSARAPRFCGECSADLIHGLETQVTLLEEKVAEGGSFWPRRLTARRLNCCCR